jgi:hypothetical protein
VASAEEFSLFQKKDDYSSPPATTPIREPTEEGTESKYHIAYPVA